MLTIGLISGCIAPYSASNPYPLAPRPGMTSPEVNVVPAYQTVDLENADRVARFRRLSGLNGIMAPAIDQINAEPYDGSTFDRSIPVLRIAFDEKILFDFDSDQPREEASQALDLIADSLRHDVPDVQLTLLGHTDALGSDAYNDELSLRRARQIFQALVDRGANAAELSTVAVGKRQPIAPNSNPEGRARNRRVELLVSTNLDANLSVVTMRAINIAYLSLGNPTTGTRSVSLNVAVLRPQTYSGPSDVSEAMPHGKVVLQPLGNVTLTTIAPTSIEHFAVPISPPVSSPLTPPPDVHVNTPTPVELAPLGPSVSY